jgi:hypothetical protein
MLAGLLVVCPGNFIVTQARETLVEACLHSRQDNFTLSQARLIETQADVA